MIMTPIPPLFGRAGLVFLSLLCAVAIIIPALNLLVSPASPLHVPDYIVTLVGKYLCYALLALSVDLVWGYCGILSLGHGAFFALGGYAIGHAHDAADRRAGRLWQCRIAGFHGVPELEGTALVLARV